MDSEGDKGQISTTELHEHSVQLVKRPRFEAPSWDQRAPPLLGRLWISELEPGMKLRLADVEDRFGLKSQALLPAGVKIALVMEGGAQVRYGECDARLGPDEPQRALIVALPDKTAFTRSGRVGARERTLTLSLSPHWLSRHGYASSSVTCELRRWTPSPGLLALGDALFAQRFDAMTPATRLMLGGFARLLAGEALSLAPVEAPAPRQRRLDPLMALIDRGEARGLDQKALAKRLGMSLSTLQRRFYQAHGEALGQFLRRHHLTLAREALERGAADVEAAATLAGYSSATNFATAFKREFGASPNGYRRRALAMAQRGR
ncbi:AraC family transcriptional regulator [Halomonas sp. PAMB 3264]|uniref:AraC family transcriptional regulator n=1 Tax=Halomonas sp. PAMB 3264 TaxID=3075222 RepID=UPI00289C0D86|nr:AraC family transcriptional regulator [Halomonas sp. PAMB 3264]WNL43593.1 AraC family transcriptional regulator [Halomonas sp. PAMB 3264]